MSFDRLFSPISINQMRLQNRIVLLPMHDNLGSKEGFVTPECIDFYLRRAKGGVAMVIIGAAPVSRKRTAGHKCIWDDSFIPGLKELTDRIHSQTEAKICLQLYDRLKIEEGRMQRVEEVSEEEIEQMRDNFAKAALRALSAGFDAIELHAAHNHALAAFLSLRNKRRDQYGGPVGQRMKVIVDTYNRIRQALGQDYPIGIRIDGDEFIVEGNTLTHSSIIATKLAEMGIDYVSVSAGAKVEDMPALTFTNGRPFPYPPWAGYSGYRCIPPAYMPEAVNVYLAEAIKRRLRQAGLATPVITAGRIPHPEVAEDILKEGQADLIGLARPLLRDPEWARKAQEGRSKDIARCEYDNTCIQRCGAGDPTYCKYEMTEEELKRLKATAGLGRE